MWQKNFNSIEIDRYNRQLLLKELNHQGQLRLKQSKVLVVGVGGLGSAVLPYLCAAGVGTIGLVDKDKVELSNLNRQTLHFTADIGRYKVDSAIEKLASLNPEVTLHGYPIALDQENIEGILSHYDVVVDAVDNFETRYLINDTCYKMNIPVVEGAVLGFVGTCTTIDPKHTGCYRCIYPSISQEVAEQTCAQLGIIGAVAGFIGSIQALEAIKVCAQIKQPLYNRLLFFDGLDMEVQMIELKQNPSCGFCK